MKNVNYKRLRNLPKFDIGTRPISSGYQPSTDPTQVGYFTQQATPITNSFIPQAITQSAGDLTSVATLFKDNWSALFPSKAATMTSVTSPTASEYSASNAANAASTVATNALGALAAIHGGVNFAKNQFDYSNTLSSSDLQNASSKSTEYINGVAYDRYGGFDQSGADKYVKAQNNAGMMNGITSGMETGAGVGTMIAPGIGTAIGAGIGAIGGWIGGLFGRSHRKNKYHRALENWRTAASNYNLQSESEAASQGLRNQYYATHADEGLSVDTKNPNALVQGGEPILKYKNGKLIAAGMFPITPQTPERVDNIPVRLDKGNAKDGVIGNLRDPETGERLAVEARPWVEAYNSPDPELQALGEANLNQIMEKQEQLQKMKKIRRYHRGRCLPMFDTGLAMSIIPAAIGSAASLSQYFDYKKDKPTARKSYSPNTQAEQALSLLARRRFNMNPTLSKINDATRHAQYSVNASPYSPGQRMAMLSSIYNNRMKSLADAYEIGRVHV